MLVYSNLSLFVELTADGLISFLFKNHVISGFGVPDTLHSTCTLSPSVAV